MIILNSQLPKRLSLQMYKYQIYDIYVKKHIWT